MSIEVKIVDDNVDEKLQAIIDVGESLRPLLKQIGEYLVLSTKERFKTATAPDGKPWEENSETALKNHLRKYKSSFKRGKLTKSGQKRADNKRLLVGESKQLSTLIFYEAERYAVAVGSPVEYSAVHQFGAKRGEFGQTKHGVPLPFNNIPARPFLGLSAEDKKEILHLIDEYYTDIIEKT